MDRRTDGQTDGRQADRYIPRSFSGRGIKTWRVSRSGALLFLETETRQLVSNPLYLGSGIIQQLGHCMIPTQCAMSRSLVKLMEIGTS